MKANTEELYNQCSKLLKQAEELKNDEPDKASHIWQIADNAIEKLEKASRIARKIEQDWWKK